MKDVYGDIADALKKGLIYGLLVGFILLAIIIFLNESCHAQTTANYTDSSEVTIFWPWQDQWSDPLTARPIWFNVYLSGITDLGNPWSIQAKTYDTLYTFNADLISPYDATCKVSAENSIDESGYSNSVYVYYQPLEIPTESDIPFHAGYQDLAQWISYGDGTASVWNGTLSMWGNNGKVWIIQMLEVPRDTTLYFRVIGYKGKDAELSLSTNCFDILLKDLKTKLDTLEFSHFMPAGSHYFTFCNSVEAAHLVSLDIAFEPFSVFNAPVSPEGVGVRVK